MTSWTLHSPHELLQALLWVVVRTHGVSLRRSELWRESQELPVLLVGQGDVEDDHVGRVGLDELQHVELPAPDAETERRRSRTPPSSRATLRTSIVSWLGVEDDHGGNRLGINGFLRSRPEEYMRKPPRARKSLDTGRAPR
jgi:hypothetical protein